MPKDKKDVWTTREGEKVPVSQMELSHLENSIAMLERGIAARQTLLKMMRAEYERRTGVPADGRRRRAEVKKRQKQKTEELTQQIGDSLVQNDERLSAKEEYLRRLRMKPTTQFQNDTTVIKQDVMGTESSVAKAREDFLGRIQKRKEASAPQAPTSRFTELDFEED